MAPLNSTFMDWIQKGTNNSLQAIGRGHIPSPLDLSHLVDRPGQIRQRGFVLPSAFDLRKTGRLPPVRDQGATGNCWAFASLACLESYLLPDEKFDFSENHMIHRLSSDCSVGFDWPANSGGNHLMAAAYLARMDGPVLEQVDPYQPDAAVCCNEYPPVKHLQGEIFLQARMGPLDNDTIKQAMMKYGAVYTSIFLQIQSYNPRYAAYYYPGEARCNHDLCLVGWDDHFPRGLFKEHPPGDGAYIARNSFGVGWGEKGYFYISYYDTRLGQESAVFCQVEDVITGLVLYQHDPLGWIRSVGFGDTRGWGANLFTAHCSTELLGISTYAASPGTVYQGCIYLDPHDIHPCEGRLAAEFQGTVDYAGYFTCRLNDPVWIREGQKFSVVVHLDTPAYYCPLPIQTRIASYSSRSQGRPGQGFISGDGLFFEDLYFTDRYANLCIKAFGAGHELDTATYTYTK